MKRTHTLIGLAITLLCGFATAAQAALIQAENCTWETFVYEENGAVIYEQMECDTGDGGRSIAAIRQKMQNSYPTCTLHPADPFFTLTGTCYNPVAWIPEPGPVVCLQPDAIYGNLTAWQLFSQNNDIYTYCGTECGYRTTVLEQGSLFEVKCNNDDMLN